MACNTKACKASIRLPLGSVPKATNALFKPLNTPLRSSTSDVLPSKSVIVLSLTVPSGFLSATLLRILSSTILIWLMNLALAVSSKPKLSNEAIKSFNPK